MSTNHTPNFNLCQWEATDKVLRTDFNQDNQKIDAALSAHDTALAGKVSSGELAALAQRTTALASRPALVTGTYTGDGTASRTISLGFTPKAVLVMPATGHMSDAYLGYRYGGLALDQSPVTTSWSSEAGDPVLNITEGGFQVYYDHSEDIFSNQEDTLYHYIALR